MFLHKWENEASQRHSAYADVASRVALRINNHKALDRRKRRWFVAEHPAGCIKLPPSVFGRTSAVSQAEFLSSSPLIIIAQSGSSLEASPRIRPHPPGPFATYQGFAQVTGILKERTQDYYLAETGLAINDDIYCSETPWMDCGPELHADNSRCGASASAAGCSTSNSGPGLLSSMYTSESPFMVVTGVFDGHGGEMAARYAQKAMLSYVATDRQLHQSLGVGDLEGTRTAFQSAFRRVDDELLARAADPVAATTTAGEPPGCDSPGHCPPAAANPPTCSHTPPLPSPPAPSAAPPCGGSYRDGTTALVTVQLGGRLAVANAGDSRAVLCREGQAVRLSRDHTPALRSERERIEAAGGQVVVARGAARVLVPLAGSNERVMQALSVSRSLGDPDFKAHGLVIPEPDVELLQLRPGHDAFLIAASDGLWGRVSDQEAVECVGRVLSEYAAMSHAALSQPASAAQAAARQLLRLALDAGSIDDVTVVVCVFAWEPQ